MMPLSQIFLMIALMGAITWGLRALPFFFKDWLNAHPLVDYIKSRFPLLMMLILVVYASEAYKAQHWMDIQTAVLCMGLTAALQFFFRNALLSLFAGVALYVVMVNV